MRTKFRDIQIYFGSGSGVDADDIPDGITNVLLTRTTQLIEGIKVFDSDVQVSGSITATDNIYTNQDIFINSNGPEGDGYLYFYEGSETGRYLKWDNSNDRFELNDSLNITISGSIFKDVRIDGILDLTNYQITNVEDPTKDQDAATKIYVDEALGVDVSVTKVTFDITANTSVIAAAGGGIKNKIVAISMHNNELTGGNDEQVKITDGDGGTVLVGGGTGNIYLVGRGGFWGLPMSVVHHWFETSANTALYINPTNGYRVSGAVWYKQEA